MSNTPVIGIIGGGQLGRMSAQAAQRLGLSVVILDSDSRGPAAQVTSSFLLASGDPEHDGGALATAASIITLENEWVDPKLLKSLALHGRSVLPGPETLAVISDKYLQRERFAQHGLPGPEARLVDDWAIAQDLAIQWGYPLVLKARSGGYDGYGVRIIRDVSEWTALNGKDPSRFYIEQYVEFERELAVMVARNEQGELRVYPVAESRQTPDGYRCDLVVAPASSLPAAARESAANLAVKCVEAVGGIGLFGVELFVDLQSNLMVNEIAPRPHNSGHYTMDSCVTSQFEQHIRAVANLPLGSTDLVVPVAAMANLLAPKDGDFDLGAGLARALRACPDVHPHWYGKSHMRAGRKMGHINGCGGTAAEAEEQVVLARNAFWGEND